jgi:hypothetical protein
MSENSRAKLMAECMVVEMMLMLLCYLGLQSCSIGAKISLRFFSNSLFLLFFYIIVVNFLIILVFLQLTNYLFGHP